VEEASAKLLNASMGDGTGKVAVSDGSSGGFVDDTEDIHARDGFSILGRLTPRVVKVGRDGDDGVVDEGAEIKMKEEDGGNFFGKLKREID
jgi:hypothetical protein